MGPKVVQMRLHCMKCPKHCCGNQPSATCDDRFPSPDRDAAGGNVAWSLPKARVK